MEAGVFKKEAPVSTTNGTGSGLAVGAESKGATAGATAVGTTTVAKELTVAVEATTVAVTT